MVVKTQSPRTQEVYPYVATLWLCLVFAESMTGLEGTHPSQVSARNVFEASNVRHCRTGLCSIEFDTRTAYEFTLYQFCTIVLYTVKFITMSTIATHDIRCRMCRTQKMLPADCWRTPHISLERSRVSVDSQPRWSRMEGSQDLSGNFVSPDQHIKTWPCKPMMAAVKSNSDQHFQCC